MPLLERVATLIKANLNDLVDKAENPEKLLKQLLLDMQNQLMQVKTQVAIAIADQHLLEKKQQENLTAQKDWLRKAELAVEKNEDALARTALERSLTFENAASGFSEQIEDQSHQVQLLRDALHRLEQKMTETKARTDLLIAQHRRARMTARAGAASAGIGGPGLGGAESSSATFDRAQRKVLEAEALSRGYLSVAEENAGERLAKLERSDQVERLLAELRARSKKSLGPAT